MDLFMFHIVKRYNDIKLSKQKDFLSLNDISKINLMIDLGYNSNKISKLLKIKLNQVECVFEKKKNLNLNLNQIVELK